MAKDSTNTEIDFSTDPRAAMRDFIGGYPWNRMGALPDLDAGIDELEASKIFAGLDSRDAYLDWVASYKALVNAAAAHIKTQKDQRKSQDDRVRYRAQEEADYIGRCVTVAIHLRRLGKRWSAARAAEKQAAA